MPPSVRTWVRVTTLGWLLGVPLVIALALAAESLGIGGAQTMVGLGVGLGVGLVQAGALRVWLPRRALWTAVTGLGLALPFVVADVLPHLGYHLGYSLTWCVIIGGAVAGVGQALLLNRHVTAAPIWIVISALGWAAAGGVASLAGRLNQVGVRGILGAFAYLSLVGIGGGILGLVTGCGFRLLPPRQFHSVEL